MKYILSITLTIFVFNNALSQGKLMLVGGGTELDDSWSWSNTPYQWAVDQSGNKKVAIIAFSESSDPEWLPNYFTSLGAIAAKNFIINTTDSANSQLTYNTLMTYDVLFFKGGDQSNYYETYKNSKVAEAITDKYNEGGVIAGTSAGMAIISEIVYTAESGTLYPDQALENIDHQNITLQSDFVNILNGYVVDTHFIERGRHARLAAFVGNWFINENENITGIGVDDRTAFCIDQNNIGTVYGTGAVTLLSSDNFGQQNGKPVADSIHTVALLHNQKYNLNTSTIINELDESITPEINEESGKYSLYLSGSIPLNANENLLNDAIVANDSVIIVSNQHSNIIDQYLDYLETINAKAFTLYISENADSCQSIEIRNLMRLSDKFIFIENDLESFMNYLTQTANGRVLNTKIRQDNSTTIFVGEDSKLAGKYFVTNNTSDELNAYYGDLEFAEGIGLLKTSTIIPDAYDPNSSDYYENNTAAALYTLGHLNLKYAALINRDSYVKYYNSSNSIWLDGFGKYSVMLVTNVAKSGGFSSQQVKSSGNERQVAGYDQLKISLIHQSPVFLGSGASSNSVNLALELLPPTNLVVTATENNVVLEWTDNSQSEDGYRIERSVNDEEFILLDELPANTEQYTDSEIVKGNNYNYRIQVVDEEQSSCYSEIASIAVVTSTRDSFNNEIRVYPNPASNGRIVVECNFKGFVEFYNTFGQKLIRKEIKMGLNEINADHLPAGIMYLRLIDSSRQNEEKYIPILNTK